MNNPRIAEMFENIAGLLEMKAESVFTIRAYQRAARTIAELPTELDQMVREGRDLKEIPSIGQAIAKKITEMVTTGGLKYFERLRAEFPYGIVDVMHVPGVGPKTATRLWKELGISSVTELERAAEDGSLAALARMGREKAGNILREIRSSRTKV